MVSHFRADVCENILRMSVCRIADEEADTREVVLTSSGGRMDPTSFNRPRSFSVSAVWQGVHKVRRFSNSHPPPPSATAWI